MPIKHLLKALTVAAFCGICLSSLSSCGMLNDTTGEVLQTILSAPDTKMTTASRPKDDKKYDINIGEKVKEADKEKKRQDSQPLRM